MELVCRLALVCTCVAHYPVECEFSMGVCQSHEDAMRHVAARTVEAGRQVCGDAWGEGQERVPGLPITPTCLQVVGNKVDAEGAKVIGQMDSPGLTKVKVLIS